jgi:hypothetical protein
MVNLIIQFGDAEPHFQTGIAIQIGDAVDNFGDAGGNTLTMPGDAGGNTSRACRIAPHRTASHRIARF